MTPTTDPRTEEAAARRQLRNAEKGRKANADSERWRKVKESAKRTGCKCELRRGMSYRELVDLGSGCTGSDRFRAGWVCPTLDLYRRLVGRPG
jgi:hypothetical protein